MNPDLARFSRSVVALATMAVLNQADAHGATLSASNGAADDNFGGSVSRAGSIGLVGAFGDDGFSGSAYVFRNLDGATNAQTQSATLTASTPSGSQFGISASLSGNRALIGANTETINDNPSQGAVYLFRGLDTATGTVTEDAKLTASDGGPFAFFGTSVALSGDTGVVGALNAGASGAAYVFRDLGTATGSVTERAILTVADNTGVAQFGSSVGLSGTTALVGAQASDNLRGSAYVFRNLDTATNTATESATLHASDRDESDSFGGSVSVSGNIGLVGASGDDMLKGAAYVFRNLDTATNTVTEDLKLTASDGAAFENFGISVSISGSTGLVGASWDQVGANIQQGSAYVFRNLDTASGTATESLKLTASDGAALNQFGHSVSLSGDQFIIGATGVSNSTGRAYTGSLSSLTTVDAGATSRTINGLSFISQEDWIIGQTTDGNQVTLAAGGVADITAAGKAVYVGRNAGSDNNTLTVNGTLVANSITVSASGSTGNTLVVNGTATNGPVTINSGGILAGSGTVGSTTVNSGGTLSPGSSPGTLNIAGDVTWLAGGNYNWQILDAVGTAGTQWDLISATGQLDLSALSLGNEFNINLWSLASIGPDVNGNIANFNPGVPYQWLIATAAGGVAGFTGTDQFNINTGPFNGTAGFSNPFGGTFSVTQSGNNLYLEYNAPLPEPGTWAVGALLVTAAAATAWRRRRSAARS